MKKLLLLGTLLVPALASAASFKEIVNNEVVPLVDSIVALMYGLAFIFFLIGMVRFFFSGEEENRKKGKGFMLWGLVGLVVLFSIWGFVKLLLSVLPGAGA